MSRLASSRGSSASAGRGASAGGAAAQRRVAIQAPRSDIYVALLGISLAAIILATVLMTLLFSQYGFSTKV